MKKITALTTALILCLCLFTACSKQESAKNPDVADIFDAYVEKVGEENMPAFMDGDSEVLSTYYYIDSADLESFVLKFPLMNVKADEFFVAKVSEGKMDSVKEGIAKRHEDVDAQWKLYLPDQYELVQKAKTIVNGDYILFVIGSEADTAEKVFNEMTK